MTSKEAFDSAILANPRAVGAYLGAVALKARELRAEGVPAVDSIDTAFGLTDPPLELDARTDPSDVEILCVRILLGDS
jgi:hypothetical protein